MTYRQTLPARDAHTVGRLESFGDVVVGFSMSLLALQLDIPKTPHDVFGNWDRYVVFFFAFGVVSLFWLRFQRIMSNGFAPSRLDVLLLFAFLAFVVLVPYALLTYSRLRDVYAPEGLMLYLAVFLGVVGFSWLLSVRGMRRAWSTLDEKERRATWRAVVSGGIAIPGLAISLVCVGTFGTHGFRVIAVLAPLIVAAGRLAGRPWPPLVGPQAGTPPAADAS